MAPDPALFLEAGEKRREPPGHRQPLVHRAPADPATIRMHTGGVGALALEHGQQFFLEIEAVDYLRSAQADLVQAVAVPHPFEEGRAPAKLRQVVVERAQGLARMPAGGVVDGHVQLEVVGVEAQLAQL